MDGVPTKVKTIVVSAQHNSDISISTIEMDVINNVINKVVPKDLIDDDTNIFVNPTGQFIIEDQLEILD